MNERKPTRIRRRTRVIQTPPDESRVFEREAKNTEPEPLERISMPDGTDIVIRHAEAADAQGIVTLYNQIAAEKIHITPDKYPGTAETETHAIDAAAADGSGRFVAIRNGRIVAECSIFREPSSKRRHTATAQVAVLKALREQGIARRLLGTALSWAADSGIEKICLSVFATNLAARKLYEAFGFEVEGTRTGQIMISDTRVDEIFMGKFLKGRP